MKHKTSAFISALQRGQLNGPFAAPVAQFQKHTKAILVRNSCNNFQNLQNIMSLRNGCFVRMKWLIGLLLLCYCGCRDAVNLGHDGIYSEIKLKD